MNMLITVALVMIAFRVSEHYWLISLFGGYVVTAFAPIAVLGAASAAYRFIGKASRPGSRALAVVWIPLVLYVGTGTLALFVYEPTLDALITWLAYIWGPVLIFVSLLWLPAFNSDKAIRNCTRVLIVVGFVFSLHAIYSFAGSDAGTIVPATLQTNQGERDYRTTYVAGFLDAESTRWTVPGINTSHFAPMLLPLVFVGLLFARQRRGVSRVAYLVATGVMALTIVGALSRGAMIPLIIGLVYLGYVKWYRWFGTLIAAAAVVVLLSLQPIMLARILMTIGAVIPLQGVVGTWAGESVVAPIMDARVENEDHFLTVPYTLDMILDKPVLGHGWTNFTEDQSWENRDIGGKDHNNYLSIAAAFGVPALVFYVCFIMGLGVGIRRALKSSAPGSASWQTGHIWAAILIAYAFYLIGAPAEFHFLWVWYGLMAAWVRNQLYVPEMATRRSRLVVFRPAVWQPLMRSRERPTA